MAAMCGPGCGWCGRCTAAWEDDYDIEYDNVRQPEMVRSPRHPSLALEAVALALVLLAILAGFSVFGH